MKQFKTMLRKVLSFHIAVSDAYALEKEFSVPTLRRCREGYNAKDLSSLRKY